MKSTMIKTLILTVMVIGASLPLVAQIEGDPDMGGSVPVDGGIVTVALLAAAYGVKRKRDINKEDNKGGKGDI